MAGETALGLRLARRELRGGLRGFRVFLACLALGVAAIAGVGSLSEAVTRGIAAQGRALLGGDVELRLSMRPATAEERAYLAAAGRLSEAVSMHTMAAPEGHRPAFVHLKAVDDAYPLYGAVALDPAMPLARALAARDGVAGAIAEPTLMRRLGLAVGDRLRVGAATFEVRAAITGEPDRVTSGIAFGPRLMIARDALAATGLVQPGSLVRHYYRLAMPAGADVVAWTEGLRAAFPDAGWRIRDTRDPEPSLRRYIDRLAVFLTLVGLATLLIGGVGVGGAVKAYLDGRRDTIATLKCLGASSGLVFRVYLAEVLALAALGVAIGLALGAVTPLAAAGLVEARLPGMAALGVYPRPLALAAAFGLLTAVAFALWPLARVREVPAAGLFRDIVAPAARRPRWPMVLVVALMAAALAGLAVASVTDRSVALWFVGGAAAALIVLAAAAAGLKRLARAAPRPRRTALRLALANLHRPGAPTAGAMVALGLGLGLVTAVGLVEGNIGREIALRIADGAPAFYFVDIQDGEVDGFAEAVAAVPGATRFERVPHLRGRVTHIKGTPVEAVAVDPSAAWVVASDRGITYSAAPPPGSRVVAGAWWPADYRGPPLVSLDEHTARGLGLGVGDSLTVNVLGRSIEATVANLRVIDWTTLGINFVLVFAPGTLEAAPQTHVATVHAPPASEDAVLDLVAEHFPGVATVRVREVLDSIAALLGQIGAAARATAALTLVASGLVVGGAVAAGQRRRRYDAVVLKVVGATRATLARAYLLEFAALGAVAGVAGAGLGAAAAYLVVTRVMELGWTWLPGSVAAGVALCLALALAIGFAGTWRALGQKAAPVLRHD